MKHATLIVAAAIVGLAIPGIRLFAGDSDLPQAVQQARTTRDKSVEQANTVYRNVLQKELDKATRSGNLDLANRIKAEMEGLGNVAPANAEPVGRRWVRFSRQGDAPVVCTLEDNGILSTSGPTMWHSWASPSYGVLVFNEKPEWRFRLVQSQALVGDTDEVRHLIFVPDQLGQ